MLTLLLEKLREEEILPQRVLHSFRVSTIQCPDCKYEAANDVSSDPLIIARVSPDDKEQDMAILVNRTLSGPDAICPDCERKGKTIPMNRSTNPRLIVNSDLLLITIGR